MRKVYKIISLILINAFLLLDIVWAGNMDFSIIENTDNLSAQIQISNPDFYNYFLNGVNPDDMGSKLDEATNLARDDLFTFDKINNLLSQAEQTQGDSENAISLQVNYFAPIGAGLTWGWDKVQGFIVQNQVLLTNIGFSFAVIGLSLAVVMGIYKNYQRFIRSIQPLRMQWYSWRLGLKAGNYIDQIILRRIYASYSRKELLEDISSSVSKFKDEQKILTLDPSSKQSNDAFEERFSIVLKKLSRMGIGVFSFKSFLDNDKLVASAEKTDKSSNKKTTLQASSWATAGALFMTDMENSNDLSSHNLIAVAALALGGIVIVSSALMYKPLRMQWYIWRLDLKRGDVIDLVIKNMIAKSNNRNELINLISLEIDKLNGEEKNRLNENLAKRFDQILVDKLYKMGTKAFYYKVFFGIYSNAYRAFYYKRVLKLNNQNNFDKQFLQDVLGGKSLQWLISDCVNIAMNSDDIEPRRLAINMLNKIVKAGLLKKQALVSMYLEVADSKFLDTKVCAIFGLKDHIKDIDQTNKIKLILKLEDIINNKEKEVRKIKLALPFKRVYAYNRNHADQKEELLKSQALYIHMVMDLLSNFEENENINDIIKIVEDFKEYVDLLGNDVNSQFSEYLEPILAVLIKNRDQLADQLKPESLSTMIVNNIPGKNNKNTTDKQVKNQLKQTVDRIKIVSELLKQLKQKRNNYGIFSRSILTFFDIVAAIKNLKQEKKKDMLEQANICEKIGLIEQAI
ncbi:MAG: hypothetical protein KJ915_08930 [Candidatus Omnitrophica bacterium]|nr:hypothetical protein [Candidatus Omnitrophota bacterium]